MGNLQNNMKLENEKLAGGKDLLARALARNIVKPLNSASASTCFIPCPMTGDTKRTALN